MQCSRHWLPGLLGHTDGLGCWKAPMGWKRAVRSWHEEIAQNDLAGCRISRGRLQNGLGRAGLAGAQKAGKGALERKGVKQAPSHSPPDEAGPECPVPPNPMYAVTKDDVKLRGARGVATCHHFGWSAVLAGTAKCPVAMSPMAPSRAARGANRRRAAR